MATILSVHGTWAHVDAAWNPVEYAEVGPEPGSPEALVRPWWAAGSAFEHEMKSHVTGVDGPAHVERYLWSGTNSEIERRAAGRALYDRLLTYEARREPYCVIGHSHGGSVIAEALIQAAMRRNQLPHMTSWITVGTPFIRFQPEQFFFQRLNLLGKVIWIASWMLFLMFAVYAAFAVAADGAALFSSFSRWVLAAAGAMMCLPIIGSYVSLRYLDRQTLSRQRPRLQRKAADYFGARWRSLTHPEDEVVEGLEYLPAARFAVFERDFAVHRLTFLSVLALPLLYLSILSMPNVMVGIADGLRRHVYGLEVDAALEKSLRQLKRDVPSPGQVLPDPNLMGPPAPRGADRDALLRDYWTKRRDLEARHHDVRSVDRALRFKQRFFEIDETPCPNNQLCGGGKNLRINAALLLHIVTDELSWLFGAESLEDWSGRTALTLIGPMVLVPLVSGLLAIGIMGLFWVVAKILSFALARGLNAATRREVSRSLLGNDTSGEVATGVLDRPVWLSQSPPRLPLMVARAITEHSDIQARNSIAKFRRGIGQLNASGDDRAADPLADVYFTWRELVHSSYFEVAAFRRVVVETIILSDGFRARPDRTPELTAEERQTGSVVRA